jgi:hypothetical protein
MLVVSRNCHEPRGTLFPQPDVAQQQPKREIPKHAGPKRKAGPKQFQERRRGGENNTDLCWDKTLLSYLFLSFFSEYINGKSPQVIGVSPSGSLAAK